MTVWQCASAAGAREVPLHGMTESPARPDTNDAVITEALAVIDQALAQMLRRELVSSNEVADLLLDVRTALTAPAAETV